MGRAETFLRWVRTALREKPRREALPGTRCRIILVLLWPVDVTWTHTHSTEIVHDPFGGGGAAEDRFADLSGRKEVADSVGCLADCVESDAASRGFPFDAALAGALVGGSVRRDRSVSASTCCGGGLLYVQLLPQESLMGESFTDLGFGELLDALRWSPS